MGPSLVYGVRLVLYFLPKNAAFVIGGALVAPHYRLATAFALATIAIAISLLIHVLGQKTVGPTNYLHFAAESAGAACGALFIGLALRRSGGTF